MVPKKILVADDEPTVRGYVVAILRNAGFEILEAADGLEALALVKSVEGDLDLLLTDMRMPRMDGLGLARAVREMDPHMPILYISGYPADMEPERLRNPKGCGFLDKPFRPKALLEAVRKCLGPDQVALTTA